MQTRAGNIGSTLVSWRQRAKRPEITSDDVIAELAMMPGVPTTHNLAAIGPAMKRGMEMGILRHTDRVKRSEIKHKRGNLHTVWESKVYR